MINVTIADLTGTEQQLNCKEGATILQIAREHDVPLDAECDGSLSCSTCHVILDEQSYAKLSSPGTEECDLLDIAFNRAPTSRLGCQVCVTSALDGIKITLPGSTL